MEKIKLGISTCLLGKNVRYDGGHQLNRFLTDTLGQYVKYIPLCPEVECGLSVPREPMHLEGNPESPRLITNQTRKGMTDRLVAWAHNRMTELEKEDLYGFIFKSHSPSCGMEQVKVHDQKGRWVKKGIGVFAELFMEHFPLIPVEDEERLHDPRLGDNFIARIFTMKRWREVRSKKESRGSLINFHTRHKLLILSHSPNHYRMMGNLVGRAKELPLKKVFQQYQTLLMESLQLKITPKKNANVLMHTMGYLREQLTSDRKQELLEAIDRYRKEYIPLIVPITLLNHYVRKFHQPYLKQQVYLTPHPLELLLRNHA